MSLQNMASHTEQNTWVHTEIHWGLPPAPYNMQKEYVGKDGNNANVGGELLGSKGA